MFLGPFPTFNFFNNIDHRSIMRADDQALIKLLYTSILNQFGNIWFSSIEVEPIFWYLNDLCHLQSQLLSNDSTIIAYYALAVPLYLANL